MQYTISTEDIKNYLNHLADNDHVGIPNHSDYCLIAETLRWKYPKASRVRVESFNAGAYVDFERVDFPKGVYDTAEKFDGLAESEDVHGDPVTVATLRVYMPELFGQEGN